MTTRQYVRALFERFQPNLSEFERELNVVAAMEGDTMKDEELLAETVKSSMSKIANSIGVLSISEICDDILMWSHYSSSHQGVCLQFYSSIGPFLDAQKVIYQERRPVANMFTDSPAIIHEKGALTKSSHWSYEKEWSIIDHGRPGAALHQYPRFALCGIVLGARINTENEELVRSWIKRRSSIKISKAFIDPTKFAINIVDA